MGGIVWQEHPETMAQEIVAYGRDIDTAAFTALNYYRPQVESYAKQNHPWQNVTRAAEDGLIATVDSSVGLHILYLGHSVWYGIYLEAAKQGRWAIIAPTMERFLEPITQQIISFLRSRR